MASPGHKRRPLPVPRGIAAAVGVLLLTLVSAGQARAQEVTLRADRTTLALDDDVMLEVRASGDFDTLTPPPTPGFTVTGQSQSSQFTIVNGRTSAERVLHLQLTPQEPGKHRVGPATASRGGRVVARSDVLELTVSAASQSPQSPAELQNVGGKGGEPVFIVPRMPRRPVYVGEPFVLSYDLFVRQDVRVTGAQWRRAPDLSQFSADPLDESPHRRTQRVGRYRYWVSEQSRHLVVPLSEGKVRVGGSVLELLSGDIFSQRRHKLKIPPLEIDVRAVPQEGRPPGFRQGSLGRFDLAVELAPAKVQAGERVVLTLRVSGTGNLRALEPPPLPTLPDVDVEALPSADVDKVEVTEDGLQGTRVFQWVLVPREQGTLSIPAIRFPYFDPEAGRFEEATTEPLTIEVEGRAVATPAAPTTPATVDELRDIRAESDLVSRREYLFIGQLWFWLVLGAALLSFLGVEVVTAVRRRRNRNRDRVRMRRARQTAERRLKGLEPLLAAGQSEDVFREVADTLHQFMIDRFQLSLRGRTHDATRRALEDLGASGDTAAGFVQELENCDFARFAPVEMRGEEMRRSMERARELMAALDKLAVAEEGGRS